MTPRHTRSTVPVAVLPWLALAAAACGDGTNLRDGLEPPLQEEDDRNLSPLRVGTELFYYFNQQYWDTWSTSITTTEKSSSGQLCLRITEVQDTATEAYEGEPQTRVAADTRVAGFGGGGDVYFGDQDDAMATAQEVDAYHSVLLLDAVTPKTRGHGLLLPIEVTYTTHQAPLPPASGVGALPFFEARRADGWGGWEPTGGDTGLVRSFFNGFLAGELGFSADDFNDPLAVDTPQPVTSSTTCEQLETAQECSDANECLWDGAACWGLSKVEATWREEANLGGAGARPVVHRLLLEYTSNGILRRAGEVVVPDLQPSVSAEDYFGDAISCAPTPGDQPCAIATVELDPGFGIALCTF